MQLSGVATAYRRPTKTTLFFPSDESVGCGNQTLGFRDLDPCTILLTSLVLTKSAISRASLNTDGVGSDPTPASSIQRRNHIIDEVAIWLRR